VAPSRLIALLAALVCTLAGIACVAPLAIYLDPISLLIMVLGTAGLALFSFDDLGWFCTEALPRFLAPARHTRLSPEQSLHAARISRTVGDHALILASLCTLIGGRQMLVHITDLPDVAVFGPALAVAFLTNLYSVVMVAFVFLPMRRFFLAGLDHSQGVPPNRWVGVHAQIWSTTVVLIPFAMVYMTLSS